MPSLIIFGPPLNGQGPASQHDAVRVDENPRAVVKALSEAAAGFAPFRLPSDPATTLWVNRENVRMVRDS